MSGPLKNYKWPVDRSYNYIIGNQEDAAVIDRFLDWLTPDAVFYDIGSNIGYYSFMANTKIITGKIYAFEPTNFNNDIFKKLLLLNKKAMGHNSITWCEFAIADKERDVFFSNNKTLAESNSYVASAAIATAEKMLVKCYAIDSLIEKGYAAPGIIKIDVEGAELDVLIGATDTLKKYQPNILLATHNCITPGIKEKCIAFLQELNYVLTHTGFHNKTMDGLDDYIAIHKEKLTA